jgi:hypothetical protein
MPSEACTDRIDVFIIKRKMLKIVLCVKYVCLTKDKPIYKRQIHLLVKEDITQGYDSKSSAGKKIWLVGLKKLGRKSSCIQHRVVP